MGIEAEEHKQAASGGADPQIQWLALPCPSLGNPCIISPRDTFLSNFTWTKIETKSTKVIPKQQKSASSRLSLGSVWGFQQVAWLKWDVSSSLGVDKAQEKMN